MQILPASILVLLNQSNTCPPFLVACLACDYDRSLLTEKCPPYQFVSVLTLVLTWRDKGRQHSGLGQQNTGKIVHFSLTGFILLPNLSYMQVPLCCNQVPTNLSQLKLMLFYKIIIWYLGDYFTLLLYA